MRSYLDIYQEKNVRYTARPINICRFPDVRRRRIVKFARFTIEYGISHRRQKGEEEDEEETRTKGDLLKGKIDIVVKSEPEQRIHISAPELRNPPVSTTVRLPYVLTAKNIQKGLAKLTCAKSDDIPETLFS